MPFVSPCSVLRGVSVALSLIVVSPQAQECYESVGEYVWQVCLVTSTLFYCGVQRRVDGELPRREVSPTR